jgi:uncharacterized SAM-binding protein YcdF (DUF218 family)
MKKKERLVPVEKTSRVIYLDKRGYVGKKKTVPAIIFGLLAVLCIVYCVAIALFMGYGTKFFLIWGVLAVIFGSLTYLMLKPDILEKIPKLIKYIFVILSVVIIVLFATIEGMIVDSFVAEPAPGADYCIILGAQWKTDGPSYILQKRLEAAIEYLNDNQGTKVIVSGGQGENEPISEAAGMKQYLLEAGISEERIIVEDKSSNTNENLLYSSEFIDKENDRVVLVTNDFHMFRAYGIAKKQGYSHPEGLTAASYPAMLPNNLLREFLGIIKDTAVGNM